MTPQSILPIKEALRKAVIFTLRTIIQCTLYLYEKCTDLVTAIDRRFTGLFAKTEYVRTGKCEMTGQCCKAIGIEFPASWQKHPTLVKWLIRWHKLRYNFEQIGLNQNLLVYQCNYLGADNKCAIQRFKPKLCRDFPEQPWRGKIRLHKGCGYKYIPRATAEFKIKLHQRKNSLL
ncbi:hypothetical protein AB833_16090 [Chromatiales bacterium (ex Bugula neritina AB1)]|nr:hypothetical protein AB833_16090 [Chromatiales bacterium (ex Bugula neritina AB1)]